MLIVLFIVSVQIGSTVLLTHPISNVLDSVLGMCFRHYLLLRITFFSSNKYFD